MPMTVVVTNDALPRVRGFLASCMCEIAPGVYTAPRMSQGVRERIWRVLEDWWWSEPAGSILMTWPETRQRGGQQVQALGSPRRDLFCHEGVYLARRELGEEQKRSLTTESQENS